MTILDKAINVWMNLPKSVRNTSGAQTIKNKIKKILMNQNSGSGNGMVQQDKSSRTTVSSAEPSVKTEPGFIPPRLLNNLDELDGMLKKLDEMAAISDDELRKGFQQFYMKFPVPLPEDPDSSEYREVQMDLYQWLHGKPYSVQNEIDVFDIEAMASRPFPFITESHQTVGNQLMAIGHLIKSLDLKPGSEILEFGPGWGNTTVWLARMGHKVTAVDINDNFLRLIRKRAESKNLNINIVNGDFSLVSQFDKQFDAIVFFECFHRCANHHELIARFNSAIAPGGKIVFGAEPITDELPVPWGLRMDGESLWAIRKNGWLELGFQETYFRNLMAKHGWSVKKQVCSDTPWGEVLIATRASEGN